MPNKFQNRPPAPASFFLCLLIDKYSFVSVTGRQDVISALRPIRQKQLEQAGPVLDVEMELQNLIALSKRLECPSLLKP